MREIRGSDAGPTLALVAGVHGGKRAAVTALDVLASLLRSEDLRGTVLLVGPANLAGYRAGLAQTSPDDGLNLNRVFPGRADGRPTEQLAARILRDIVSRSDYLMDLHGSDGDEAVAAFAYAARPGLDARVDSTARALALAWGVPLVVWDTEGPRTLAESRFLQTAAHLSGVPAATVFAAGATREDPEATREYVDGALRLMRHLGMLTGDALAARADALRNPFAPGGIARLHPLTLPRREVLAASAAGKWSTAPRPGDRVEAGELLGVLVDSSARVDSVRSPARAIVLHHRLSGRVGSGTPVVILAALDDSTASAP